MRGRIQTDIVFSRSNRHQAGHNEARGEIMRTAAWILGFALLGASFTLAQDRASAAPAADQTPTATKDDVNAAAGGAKSAEVPLAVLPTHWEAKNPVGHGAGPVTAAMLKAGATGQQWLMYGGSYDNTRHSPIKDLNPETVGKLRAAWSFPTGTLGQFGVSPVVYDGVMYVTSSYNRLFALDPKSGKLLWRYDRQLPTDLRLCCGPANRGVAILGNQLFMGTLDAKLMAFDRRTGKIDWETTVIDYQDGYSITGAPLVVGNLVVIGVGGGEFGVRGFFDAYDAKTGKRVWRRYTVPGKGEPGVETWAGDSWKTGGAPSWNTGAYDPETDTLFWTVGNASPDWNGDLRKGDNLYADSVLALDPKTGAIKWHFQFTPHDVWDYDGNSHFFLIDVPIDGKTVKAFVQPNRNGYLYVLDRTNGKFLRATQYVDQLNWAKGVDDKGRPIVDPTRMPAEEPAERTCPGCLGGLNGAWTASYDPSLHYIYVPMIEACQKFQKGIVAFVKGIPFMGGLPIPVDGQDGKSYGNFKAIDVSTGKVAWTYKDPLPMMGGTLTTAGGVVFTSSVEGDALAFDSKTGKELWRFAMGGSGRSQPIAFEIAGEPYLAIGSGGFATLESFAGATTMNPEGNVLHVFKVDKDDLKSAQSSGAAVKKAALQ
jgi:alcohol dehydrogenase (cytochrome c)